MNKKKIIEQLKTGKQSLFTQTMIFHNMQEIVEQQTWMRLKNYLHYEELLKAGIIEEQYVSFMRNQNVAVISYCVGDKQDLVGAFQQMEALKEIYSSIPIRIAIQADEFNPEEVPSCYRFIKGVEIACFSKECQDEMLDWLTRSESLYISFPTFRFNTSFYRKESFYLEFQKNMNWDQHPFEKKIYFGGFFRSLLVSKELYHSIMSGYDFVEFMLSTVHYYYKAKCNEPMPKSQRILEYKEHGVEILRLSKDTSKGMKLRQDKIPHDDLLFLHNKIKKYYGIFIVGEEYNFLGLLDVLQKIRNRTRGHGVIVGKSGLVLWDFLFCSIFLLAYFLDIANFTLEVQGDKVYAGYKKQEMICLHPYVIGINDVPCIIHQIRGKQKKEYINYFYGGYAVPDYE